MKVINLVAGPGAGKSTTAAGLFHFMKLTGHSVELVTEYAKDLTWENRHDILKEQVYVFSKQMRKLTRLKGHVEWVITDSPLVLSLLYADESYYPETFTPFVLDVWESFDNYTFYIERTKKYVSIGRSQTEQEAKSLDMDAYHVLRDNNIKYHRVNGDEDAPSKIMMYLGLTS